MGAAVRAAGTRARERPDRKSKRIINDEEKMAQQAIIGALERQEWLKPAEETLQKSIHKAFAAGGATGQSVKNFLHGTWIGDPLHVILTDVPIGAWTVALVSDVLEVATCRSEFARTADTAVTVGIAGALGAAVAGVTDWQDTDPPARRIGLIHALMNVGGVALFTASLVLRRRKSRSAARTLSALGYGVMVMAARLGGHLVYSERLGVDHTAGQTLPDDFTAVFPLSELTEGHPKRAEYKTVPILLVRQGDRIFAMAETCSHLSGPLSEGKLIGDSIQCPWHGSRFALEDGRVLDGPAVHAQPCLEARVREGQIEIRNQAGQR
jgi:nitrite reductase/ring-hydroxylating ferredoxin subunit/uncharacterized membrane protein